MCIHVRHTGYEITLFRLLLTGLPWLLLLLPLWVGFWLASLRPSAAIVGRQAALLSYQKSLNMLLLREERGRFEDGRYVLWI
jgi:hypothetical protein